MATPEAGMVSDFATPSSTMQGPLGSVGGKCACKGAGNLVLILSRLQALEQEDWV